MHSRAALLLFSCVTVKRVSLNHPHVYWLTRICDWAGEPRGRLDGRDPPRWQTAGHVLGIPGAHMLPATDVDPPPQGREEIAVSSSPRQHRSHQPLLCSGCSNAARLQHTIKMRVPECHVLSLVIRRSRSGTTRTLSCTPSAPTRPCATYPRPPERCTLAKHPPTPSLPPCRRDAHADFEVRSSRCL